MHSMFIVNTANAQPSISFCCQKLFFFSSLLSLPSFILFFHSIHFVRPNHARFNKIASAQVVLCIFVPLRVSFFTSSTNIVLCSSPSVFHLFRLHEFFFFFFSLLCLVYSFSFLISCFIITNCKWMKNPIAHFIHLYGFDVRAFTIRNNIRLIEYRLSENVKCFVSLSVWIYSFVIFTVFWLYHFLPLIHLHLLRAQ